MVKEPRILIVNETPYLVLVTKKYGEIVELAGPYQCVGKKGGTGEDLLAGLIDTMQTAIHAGPALTLDDLPESVRSQVSTGA